MIRLVWQLFLTRARAGCHKVRWTLAHARPRGALAPPRNRTLAVKQHGLEKCIALLGNKKRISRRISFLITRARDGCHKVQWTLALARPRGALASREIEPLLQSSMRSRSALHFSIIKKDILMDILFY